MSAKIWKSEPVVLTYEYDFDSVGGAVSEIVLGTLPDGFIATEMFLHIDTTITSAGTPTITIGEDNSGDADGYFADFFGTPTAGVALKGGGALVSDGVHLVDSTKDGVAVNIGTAALTAGKFRVFVRGFQQ
jgi:hypothetical protein